MKVKELIEQLQKLDPERGIWVFYDFPCDCFEPDFSARVTERETFIFDEEGVQEGDYMMKVG